MSKQWVLCGGGKLQGQGSQRQGRYRCDGADVLAATWLFSLLHPNGTQITKHCSGKTLVSGTCLLQAENAFLVYFSHFNGT